MSRQPFYHLRPNKSIDRSLFVQMLSGLNGIYPISDYRYTGFGSFLFDDFRALHEKLDISNMISLESDTRTCERAKYNVPYKCIRIENVSSTDYISSLTIDDDEHNIFWLDFVEPKSIGKQLNDYAALLEMLNPHDVVRITLNAAPSTLGTVEKSDEIQMKRMLELKNRINVEYVPLSLDPENMTTTNYPLTILKILKTVTLLSLTDDPPFRPNYLLPLFSCVYSDGQQMLTFTGLVLDSHEEEEQVRASLKQCDFVNFAWDVPNIIEIPALSIREITELNKMLPDQEIRNQLIAKFPFIFPDESSRSIDSYISYYKYYPNYYKVNF